MAKVYGSIFPIEKVNDDLKKLCEQMPNEERHVLNKLLMNNLHPLDAYYDYGNMQYYYHVFVGNTPWIVAYWRQLLPKEAKKSFGPRSLMNALFHMAVLKDRLDNKGCVNVLIIMRHAPLTPATDNTPQLPLIDRAKGVIEVLINWHKVSEYLEFKEQCYLTEKCHTNKPEIGFYESEKLLENDIEEIKKKSYYILRQEPFKYVDNTSCKPDLICFPMTKPVRQIEIIELKRDYLSRDAFVELLQYVYLPLIAADKIKSEKELCESNHFSSYISSELQKITLTGLGIINPYSSEFNLMSQWLKNATRFDTDEDNISDTFSYLELRQL